MKTPLLFSLVLCLLCLIRTEPLRAEVVGLEVRNISSERRSTTLFQTDAGEYKEINRSIRLSIKIAQLGVPKEGYELEWFFVAKELSNKTRWVFDSGQKHIDKFTRFKIESQPLNAKEARYRDFALEVIGDNQLLVTTTTTDRVSGSKIEGWIVRVKKGNTVVHVEASLNELKNFAEQDPKRLDALLEATRSKANPGES